MSNTVYTYLTSTEDQLTAINVGYGCPKGLRCKRYCQSEGYYGGFCWKIVCCCIPKADTVEDVIRLVVLCLVVVVVAMLFYVHGKHLRSCRDGQLT